ncbi:MAG: BREX-2 system adenine-specific DNA-methyltransferase PglX, partial [Acetobacteraceae bacterium]
FTRHRSTPITELPDHWPDDYRAIVESRIRLIETDPHIGLIERPEYKRRWAATPWEEQEKDALRLWLLDRLEGRDFWPESDPRILSTNQLADAARRDGDFVAVAALHAGAGTALDRLVADLAARESVPFLAPLRYSVTGLRKRAQWEETWDKQRQEDAIDAEIAAAMAGRLPGEIAAAEKREKAAKVGAIPVPPKYRTPDFLAVHFWRLRGGLDVPKERFVSFPHCERAADGSLPILWAGYDHLARARAIATYSVERKERDGWSPERLAPLLAGLLELLPWLRQWHNEYNAEMGTRMADYYAEFIRGEAQSIGKTEADLRALPPPAPARRPRGRKRAP